uniref:Uncharacterized protein n=1 Tax=Trypanosoma congolense (strain IL3000) TaxID=1068625 RepID=G0UXR9_TRYCI|nr:conserved hypothetical protein [Trypanosoma congolense IL3000]
MKAIRMCSSGTGDNAASASMESPDFHHPDPELSPLPRYDDICQFIAEYSGRLPRNALVGTAPFEFTGCDYSLVLYALMPSKCIDLSRLCWSTEPLPSQLETNLMVFCEGALGLKLNESPISSLTPQNLRVSPSCIVHHIKVQHWLYTLSQRFPPDNDYDAAAVRMMCRNTQLGMPYLVVPPAAAQTGRLTPMPVQKGNSVLTNYTSQSLSAPLHCSSLWNISPVEIGGMTHFLGGALSSMSSHVEDDKMLPKARKNQTASRRAAGLPLGASSAAVRKKAGDHSGSVPNTSATRGIASDQAALSSLSSNMAEQWCESERCRMQLKDILLRARCAAESTLFSNGEVLFENVLSILQSSALLAADAGR